ncbi:MAG: dienelactone hydrolase family protein [Gemmatimonadota bacterium]
MRTTAALTFASLLSLPVATLAAQSQPDYASAMLHVHAGETPAASPATQIAPRLQVVTETVTYATVNGKPVKGFLAKPAARAGRAGQGGRSGPALLVVHEWWGLNDNIRDIAKRYAGEGYTVLAVDLFGRVATTPDVAMGLYQAAMKNIPAGEQNVGQAVAYLKKQGASSIGTVGYCFGGHWSLRAGLAGGPNVNAVVVYYGAPITDPAQLSRLKAPVLGLYGGKDESIPLDSVRAMERALKQAGRKVDVTVFPTANHAFANPSGQSYDAAAAESAWTKSLAFLKANLK